MTQLPPMTPERARELQKRYEELRRQHRERLGIPETIGTRHTQ